MIDLHSFLQGKKGLDGIEGPDGPPGPTGPDGNKVRERRTKDISIQNDHAAVLIHISLEV